MTQSSPHITWDRLNEYVDGRTSPAVSTAIANHLVHCATCRAEHAALQSTVAALGSAPVVALPPMLWNDIEASIAERAPSVSRGARRFTVSAWGLAAAAMLLIALSVSGTLWLDRRTMLPDAAASVATARDGTPQAMLQLTATDAQFVASVESLEQQLASQRSKLRPETIAILERSLHTIDDALVEARAALLADPANAALRIALEKTYRQKVDFLTRATQIASSE